MPMNPVKPIQYTEEERKSIDLDDPKVRDFPNDVNTEIAILNSLIKDFNITEKKEDKLLKLKLIYSQYQSINHKFSLDLIEWCEAYQLNMHALFFNEMVKASRELGLSSLAQLSSDKSQQVDESSLSAIMANMPYGKLQRLMTILWMNQDVESKIKALYQPGEEGYDAFKKFSDTHTFTVLSGQGNSRNLKIERLGSGTPMVLKLDPRLDMSKQEEHRLRSSSKAFTHLAQIHGVERYATFYDGEGLDTASLVITEFFPKGDLLSVARNDSSKTNERMGSTVLYYQQMASIMLKMQEKQVAFPDAKNTNWLVDANNHVSIADTKSFLPMTDEGKINTSLLLNTEGMRPPEFIRHRPILAEKMHVYLLGKAMYQYATKCRSSELIAMDEDRLKLYRDPQHKRLIEYDHSVFNTPLGAELNSLIQRMLKPNPADRISLQEALTALKNLGHQLSSTPEQQACKAMLEEMKANHEAEDIIHDVEKTLNEGMLIEIHDLPKKIQKQKDMLFAECASHIKMLKDCNPQYMGEEPNHSSIVEMKTLLAQLKIQVKHLWEPYLRELDRVIKTLNPQQQNDIDIQRFIAEKTNEINQITTASHINEMKDALEGEIGQFVKSSCHQVLKDILTNQDFQGDPKVQDYISKTLIKIEHTPLNEIPALAMELNDFKKNLLKVHGLVNETHNALNNGSGDKKMQANQIIGTFKTIALEDRVKVFSTEKENDATIKDFHTALSLHTGMGSKKKNNALSSNPSTAERSPTFRNFKERFHQLISASQEASQQHEAKPSDNNAPQNTI